MKLVSYSIPRVEDLFAILSVGKQFTKLNLLELDEESKEYVVINTPQGLSGTIICLLES